MTYQTTKTDFERGHRSGLETVTANDIKAAGVQCAYESLTIGYVQPERKSRYTPDFPLPNGIIIETKGRFLTADRQKHKFIKAQHPDLDIRFVFSNANAPLNKASKTRYRDWCDNYGFLWAHRRVPLEWLHEVPCEKRLAAIEAATYSSPRRKAADKAGLF